MNPTIIEQKPEVKESPIEANYSPGVIQVTSISHPSDEMVQSSTPVQDDFDDFDDFVDPNAPVPEPVKELTEEEKRQIEEDEKRKRLDLISSAFDEILLDDKPSEESKNDPQPNQQPSFGEEFKAPTSTNEQNNDRNSWADFGNEPTTSFGENNVWEEAVTRLSGSNFGVSEEKEQEPSPDKNQEDVFQDANKGFESFGVTDEQTKTNEDNAFPSLFDAASTPRIDTDNKTDIRMSFPSEQMWSHNFNQKDNAAKDNEAKDNKGEDDIWGSAFEDINTSKPDQNINQPTSVIVEDKNEDKDEFNDIMQIKAQVVNEPESSKVEKDEDDSFDDFADPSELPSNANKPEVSNEINFAENLDSPELKQASQSTPYDNAWANFQGLDQNVESKEQPDNSWSDFSGPSKQVTEERKSQAVTDNEPEADSKEDPFNSALFELDLVQNTEEKENPVSQSNDENNNQDQDSDFDDFVDPSQTENDKPEEKSDFNGKILILTIYLDPWADTASFGNVFDAPKPEKQENNDDNNESAEKDLRSSEVRRKEFTEQELFSGFMKSVKTTTKEVNQNEIPEKSAKVNKANEESPEKRKQIM